MNNEEDRVLLFEEFVKTQLKTYLFPLILTFLGVIFILIAFFLSVRKSPEPITFMENSASPSSRIKVDIEGSVLKPGVYDMERDSRVGDVLVFAGGLSAGADRDWVTRKLNRAAKVTDGAKIYIPAVGEIKTPMGDISVDGASTDSKININTAALTELDGLPGVGLVTAQKIVSTRPYSSIDELKTKKAVNSSTFEKIKEMVEIY
ncbi:MAG: ComE operon protein 1 [Candidatus Gottesmanbacteria bacterium GW2011_GWC2_39_8]|uniref:ComE operon protein 1 n=1 Tax=Candidatus Gottesmanbacteria bacterium GW2011_GWC2_39_8 TaxID=1618450 RepID=A0A0G0PUU3_9BACT|nr:MAG: ComE operon protein 1 [Candidatus Gottesmanbacteria bacterium GW2011_GWC2_39_8]